ncbi:hypothetical protein Nepgr_002583 [Nepenthes gracilis]|uniref:Uncharacterized protein n=1 Tax=Nepenthes gracilis TaxID=150966 RepID=A0AAD3P9T5_NEPGR|nr:hypothetical protein Nepgr_002583 [Nepenthes gracilis]
MQRPISRYQSSSFAEILCRGIDVALRDFWWVVEQAGGPVLDPPDPMICVDLGLPSIYLTHHNGYSFDTSTNWVMVPESDWSRVSPSDGLSLGYSRGITLRPECGSFSAGFLAACKVSAGWSPLDFLMEYDSGLAFAADGEGQALALCWRQLASAAIWLFFEPIVPSCCCWPSDGSSSKSGTLQAQGRNANPPAKLKCSSGTAPEHSTYQQAKLQQHHHELQNSRMPQIKELIARQQPLQERQLRLQPSEALCKWSNTKLPP